MRGYFGLGQLSSEEKSDILDQHKSVYNGYQTMQPQVSNTQPLTVYDFAGDKDGMVVNNKGEVKKYTNMGINEQVEEKSMCEQCGGQMTEGECMECGYNEGEMEESDSDWDATLMDGLEEETGHLDDIYSVRDLNMDSGFDYIEGDSNDVDTFEGMHKNLYKEDDEEDMVDYENDDNEDDGFLDDQLDEQGGNADDMNVDSVEPAYDFVSGGPDDVYPVNEYETMESAFADEEIDEEIDEVDVSGSQGIYGAMDPAYDFDSEGPGNAGPYQRFSYNEEEDEEMDDEFEEVDEDLKESFITQKNKIKEMFNRFNRYN